MNNLPNEITDDLQYCVLDYSNQHDVDFQFIPLWFLDSFPRPAADLQLGKFKIQVPLDWSIVIADNNCGHFEVIELLKLNDRPFKAFVMNPLTGFMPSFPEIRMMNIFPDVTWYVPKLKNGYILAVPLEDGPNPQCCFLVKETSKLPDILDITKIL